ncbi:MAG: phosphotransferase [Phycisphaerae bacterium]
MTEPALAIAAEFDVETVRVEPHVGGLINRSFRVYRRFDDRPAYLLQQINVAVFPDPARLMDNVRAVTEHLGRAAHESLDRERRVLRLVQAHDGRVLIRDALGGFWRMYYFVAQTRTYESLPAVRFARPPNLVTESPSHDAVSLATNAAHAFGEFQAALAGYAGPPLHETIPGFHATPRRLAALERAAAADLAGRAASVGEEIEFALRRWTLAAELESRRAAGVLPSRIVHNDAKLSNVLFDERSGEALCVIDLDTVMPGLAGHDFGDMVRSTAATAAEDEPDATTVELRVEVFEGISRGYLGATRGFLTTSERETLVDAAKVITFEQGIRFLTDFLDGDAYYRTERAGQNLDRCRVQFALLEWLERNERELRRIVAYT